VVTFFDARRNGAERTTTIMKAKKKTPAQSRQERRVQQQAQGRSDDGRAFIPDPEDGPARSSDDLAEEMAEEFVKAATTGEDSAEDLLDATVPEEIGGPFLITTASQEMATSPDESNPPDAKREALPRAVSGLVINPIIEEEANEDEEDSDPDDARSLGDPSQLRPHS
jgi:hypothetical protein